MSKTVLVLGGARSGKSSFAQRLAEEHGGDLIYIATAEAFDTEMADRIARHQLDRGLCWRTVECPVDLASAIKEEQNVGSTILVDCLTLWLSNVLLNEHDVAQNVADLVHAIRTSNNQVIFVSNEVGQGIVPDNALARLFRDEAGRLNQAIAAIADDVWFVIAGLPQRLK